MGSFCKWLNVFKGGNYRLSDSVILMLDMHVKTVELFLMICAVPCIAVVNV